MIEILPRKFVPRERVVMVEQDSCIVSVLVEVGEGTKLFSFDFGTQHGATNWMMRKLGIPARSKGDAAMLRRVMRSPDEPRMRSTP